MYSCTACERSLVVPFQKFPDLLEFCRLPLGPGTSGRSWASPAPAILRREAGKPSGDQESRDRLWNYMDLCRLVRGVFLNVGDALSARGVIEHIGLGLCGLVFFFFFFPYTSFHHVVLSKVGLAEQGPNPRCRLWIATSCVCIYVYMHICIYLYNGCTHSTCCCFFFGGKNVKFGSKALLRTLSQTSGRGQFCVARIVLFPFGCGEKPHEML